jgi:uncharacterized membrane protein
MDELYKFIGYVVFWFIVGWAIVSIVSYIRGCYKVSNNMGDNDNKNKNDGWVFLFFMLVIGVAVGVMVLSFFNFDEVK